MIVAQLHFLDGSGFVQPQTTMRYSALHHAGAVRAALAVDEPRQVVGGRGRFQKTDVIVRLRVPGLGFKPDALQARARQFILVRMKSPQIDDSLDAYHFQLHHACHRRLRAPIPVSVDLIKISEAR